MVQLFYILIHVPWFTHFMLSQKVFFNCRFPRDKNRFSQWLNALGLADENISWKKSMFICAQHFGPDDMLYKGGNSLLKSNAVPHKNLMEGVKVTHEEASTSKTFEFQVPSAGISPPRKKDTKKAFSSLEYSPLQGTKRKRSSSTESASEGSDTVQDVQDKFSSTSSGSDSSRERKRKRYKVEHSYA